MAETPRTREELWRTLVSEIGLVAEEVLDAIEDFGLRIVPAEPTKAMWEAMAENDSGGMIAEYRAAIAANPFAPEKAND